MTTWYDSFSEAAENRDSHQMTIYDPEREKFRNMDKPSAKMKRGLRAIKGDEMIISKSTALLLAKMDMKGISQHLESEDESKWVDLMQKINSVYPEECDELAEELL